MDKFKVGDKVRVLSKSCGEECECKGAISTITELRRNFRIAFEDKTYDLVYILSGATTGGQNYFLERDLELVEESLTQKYINGVELQEVLKDTVYDIWCLNGDYYKNAIMLNFTPYMFDMLTNNGLLRVKREDIEYMKPSKGGK